MPAWILARHGPITSPGNNIFMRNKSHNFYACCAHALMALFLIAAPDRICSQTVQADQRELARSQAPSPFGPNVPSGGVEAGHAAPTASDADLGEQQILKRAEEYEPLSVSVGEIGRASCRERVVI